MWRVILRIRYLKVFRFTCCKKWEAMNTFIKGYLSNIDLAVGWTSRKVRETEVSREELN